MWGIIFGEFQCLPADDCPATSCDSGVLTRDSESTSFYSIILVPPPQFIFVYGIKECSNFILSHVAVQFSQYFLKRQSFLHCIFLPPLSKKMLTICAWVYLWAFYPFPLMYISVFVPVPYCLDYCSFLVQSELRETDSSRSILLCQDFFGFRGLLCFHANCEFFCSSSVKNAIGILKIGRAHV